LVSEKRKKKIKKINKNKYVKKMAKNVSVDTKSTQGKEKNINEERNKEYEALLERVRAFKFFQDMKKKIKETEEDEEKYNNTEKIIREGEYSIGKEKYTLGVRAKLEVKFEYFEVTKHPNFNDERVYLSREFFFRKNIITDDEKKEIEKFENNILNKFRDKHISK